MMHFAVFFLLIAAGAAIVGQNLLMAQISAGVSTVLIPLFMNSAVGLAALLLLLIWRSGFSGVYEVVNAFRVWNILPGLLGSFFVFASIVGYQRLGAAATIALLVASQLVFGLVVDLARSGGIHGHAPTLAGAFILTVGAIIVACRAI